MAKFCSGAGLAAVYGLQAWSRKGLALFYLGCFKASAAAYQHALKLAPASQADAEGLRYAEEALRSSIGPAEKDDEDLTQSSSVQQPHQQLQTDALMTDTGCNGREQQSAAEGDFSELPKAAAALAAATGGASSNRNQDHRLAPITAVEAPSAARNLHKKLLPEAQGLHRLDQERPQACSDGDSEASMGSCKPQSREQEGPAQTDFMSSVQTPGVGDFNIAQQDSAQGCHEAQAKSLEDSSCAGKGQSQPAEAAMPAACNDPMHELHAAHCKPDGQPLPEAQGSPEGAVRAERSGHATRLKASRLLCSKPSGADPNPGQHAAVHPSSCDVSTQTCSGVVSEARQDLMGTHGTALLSGGAHSLHLHQLNAQHHGCLQKQEHDACHLAHDHLPPAMTQAAGASADILESMGISSLQPNEQQEALACYVQQLELQRLQLQEAMAVVMSKLAAAQALLEPCPPTQDSPTSIMDMRHDAEQAESSGAAALESLMESRPDMSSSNLGTCAPLHGSLEHGSPGLGDPCCIAGRVSDCSDMNASAEGQQHCLGSIPDINTALLAEQRLGSTADDVLVGHLASSNVLHTGETAAAGTHHSSGEAVCLLLQLHTDFVPCPSDIGFSSSSNSSSTHASSDESSSTHAGLGRFINPSADLADAFGQPAAQATIPEDLNGTDQALSIGQQEEWSQAAWSASCAMDVNAPKQAAEQINSTDPQAQQATLMSEYQGRQGRI